VWLEVRDNGVGLSGSARSQFRSGVGLSNTRDRLECLYGEAQTLEFSEGDGGLTVRIALPLQRAPLPAEAAARVA
jgi:signal transduction histidine kinase